MLQQQSLARQNDFGAMAWYIPGMSAPIHDWYLKEWLATLNKKQADIVDDLEWNKAKVSLMVRCKQQYTRDDLNELAAYLNIRPYELLMHPADAMTMRRIKSDLIRLANESEPAEDSDPAKKVSNA